MDTIPKPEIYLECFAQSDVGRVRNGNEDNYLIADLANTDNWTATNSNGATEQRLTLPTAGCLLTVADGLGGALAGEVASQMTVDLVRKLMLRINAAGLNLPYSEQLRLAIEQASLIINDASNNDVSYTGMGSTITAVAIEQDIAYLAQVGDSRCYLIRNHQIQLITKDQSLVWQMVISGYITEEEAENHSVRNIILQALGSQPQVQVVVDRLQLCRGDILLLCSDGLSGKIKKHEMLEVIESAQTLRQAGNRLIILANERGGEDNITLVVTRFDGDGLSPAQPEDPIELTEIVRDTVLPYGIDDEQLVTTSEIPSDAIEDISETTVPMSFSRGGEGNDNNQNQQQQGSSYSWWRRLFTNFGRKLKEIFTGSSRTVLRL